MALRPRERAGVTHPDEDLLSAYSLDPEGVEEREEIERHLAGCQSCTASLAEYRKLDATLPHPDTRMAADAVRHPPKRLPEYLQLYGNGIEEERAARALLRPLLKSPLKFRNADLPSKESCRTEGMVHILCAEAIARHENGPKFSKFVAATAYEIAAKLTNLPKSTKRMLLGTAMREVANAERYLGNFKTALRLLDEAEKLFDGTPSSDPHDIARVQLIRATIFMKSDRLEEGIVEARKASPVFAEYGDEARRLSSEMVEASCLFFSNHVSESIEAFERVIALSREAGDTRMLVRGLHNCANARVGAGELDRAERYYIEALALYDEFNDLPTERARATWALASLVVARGNLDEGERQLSSSRIDLAKLGLTNDAALATLEWAEVCLALGRPKGVAEATRKIVMVFADEGMQRHAKHALSVLEEAIAAGRATPELVRRVRLYLEKPAEPFVLPA